MCDWRSGALAVLTLLGPLGCDSGSDGATSDEIFCSAVCRRSAECGGWPSSSACLADCAQDPPMLSDYRPEFIKKFGSCLDRLDCVGFFQDGSFEQCWDAAKKDLPPSSDTEAFCDGWSAKWFECGSSYFPDECARTYAINARSALDRVAACEEAACEELANCVQAAW